MSTVTYVHDGVSSNKGQSIALQTDEKRQCLSWPLPLVVESGEYVLCRVVCWREVHQRYQDPEEPQHVDNKDDDFDGGQRSTNEYVDEDTENQYSP